MLRCEAGDRAEAAWHCFCHGDAWRARVAGSEEEVAWRLIFFFPGWEQGEGCLALLCTARFRFSQPERVCRLCLLGAFMPARFSNFFFQSVALIWNKKTDVICGYPTFYLCACIYYSIAFASSFARLALLLLSLFTRHGLASSSTPSTL